MFLILDEQLQSFKSLRGKYEKVSGSASAVIFCLWFYNK